MNVKNVIYILLILSIIVGPGCAVFKNPQGSWEKANAKVDKIEQKITANDKEIVNQAKQHVFAADTSLKLDKNPNRNSLVAESFTERAMLTLGPPAVDETARLRVMVANLISTNQQIIKKGVSM